MSEPGDRGEPPPGPPILWLMLAVVAILGFLVVLRMLNPPGL